jgi:hypothetical protein
VLHRAGSTPGIMMRPAADPRTVEGGADPSFLMRREEPAVGRLPVVAHGEVGDTLGYRRRGE